MFDLDDTIVALASPRGGAVRGIVRLSGPRAWEIVGPYFDTSFPEHTADFRPRAVSGNLSLALLAVPVPATLFLSRRPRSFTGQDLVEVHTLGSPPVLELALSAFVSRGARTALPGEFTMRAFLNGKLDLTEAEAVLGLIDATDSRQANVALRQMAGGIARPISRLRDQLLDLLAELEAGLDFAEEDLEFIDRSELRTALQSASERLRDFAGQMEGRSLSSDRHRAVLVGAPNVGKSTLFNALLGRDAALVSQAAGTTRDYLVAELRLTDCSIELVDTAGIEQAPDPIGRQAQLARDQASQGADLLLWCVDTSDPTSPTAVPSQILHPLPSVLVIQTKSDLVQRGASKSAVGKTDDETEDGRRKTEAKTIKNQKSKIKNPKPTHHSPLTSSSRPIPVSAHTGAGLAELREAIETCVRNSAQSETGVVASTAVRCRQAIAGAVAAITRALALLELKAVDDLVAMELRLALDELAQVVGAVYTDDILDRIFSRFCIGK